MPAFSGFDWINVANDVGNGHVRRRQFLNKARVTSDPLNRCFITLHADGLTAISRDRIKRIVINFGNLDDRNLFVEEVCKLPDDPTFSLASKTQEDGVVPGENSVD